MKPFHFLLSIWAILFSTGVVSAAPEKPNILLIFADDVGREVLGCYGGTSYRTPHIDALADGGMKFTHCYSMPVCHPSRVAILSGQYPARQGNPRWGDFDKEAAKRTFAQVVKPAGYRSAVAGKWQLALMKKNPDHPNELGFDGFSVFGWHEGPRFHDPMIYQDGVVRDDTAGKYGPDLYVEYLSDFMKTSVKKETPFLAFYSMALCHDVTDDLGKGNFVPFAKDGKWLSFAEMAESMDEMVGRLVKAVEDLGIRKDTLIIFTTDNGTPAASYLTVDENGKMVRPPVYSEFEGKKIRGGKGSFTDWGTRVPMIANWPGVIEPGQTVDDLIDFSDFLPTFADLAGAALPTGVTLDGISFADRLLKNEPSKREWAYSELRGKRFVRTRDYKLYNDGGFFNVTTSEEKPLKSEKPSKPAAKAKQQLEEALQSIPEPASAKKKK